MNLLGYDISKLSYPLFVAEISCNHCGNYQNIFKLIDDAKRSFADIVKIQVYTADELTIKKDTLDFKIKSGPWKGKNLYDLYCSTQTPPSVVQPVFDYARSIGMPIFASVFGLRSLEALEEYGCGAYKISSFEFNDLDLIKHVLETRKPIILSTGAATNAEIDNVSDLLRSYTWGTDNYIFMHCISKYPCSFDNANLYIINDFIERFGSNHVGYSDHTTGGKAAGVAAILGAKVIEKHFYNPKYGRSEDRAFSMAPEQFKTMVTKTRELMNGCYASPIRMCKHNQFKRSIYVIKDVKKGQVFSEKNVDVIRPGYGLDPNRMKDVLKHKATQNIAAGTALREDMIGKMLGV